MKKIFVFFFIICNGYIFSQKENNNSIFSNYDISLLGGINFEKISNTNGAIYVEVATNIFSNIHFKLFTGYYKSISDKNYALNSYKYVAIDDYKKYFTFSYDVLKTKYQVIPMGLGLTYLMNYENFIPYLLIDLSYNLIDPLTEKTQELKLGEYDTLEEVPINFKNIDILPNNSFGFSTGFGSKFPLTSKIELNLRYLLKIDNEIINTHQILIGITF